MNRLPTNIDCNTGFYSNNSCFTLNYKPQEWTRPTNPSNYISSFVRSGTPVSSGNPCKGATVPMVQISRLRSPALTSRLRVRREVFTGCIHRSTEDKRSDLIRSGASLFNCFCLIGVFLVFFSYRLSILQVCRG